MSWNLPEEPYQDPPDGPVETLVAPRIRDLGDGFTVRRSLPSARRRMVGPFIFFDQMGPVVFTQHHGLDVRPHPHIGLATVTYLFDGEILHRDSLGTVQPISPGAVNWMNAGKGIVHSERTPPGPRSRGSRVFGIQSWVALPSEAEESEPSFVHTEASALPSFNDGGAKVRVIAGEVYGQRSPVKTASPLFYAEATLDTNALLPLPGGHEERGVYVVEGKVGLGDAVYDEGQLLVIRPRAVASLRAQAPSRVMLMGGEPLGPRFIYWNFVHSSRDRIEQAKDDWRAMRLGRVPGDDELIPLPDEAPKVAPYP